MCLFIALFDWKSHGLIQQILNSNDLGEVQSIQYGHTLSGFILRSRILFIGNLKDRWSGRDGWMGCMGTSGSRTFIFETNLRQQDMNSDVDQLFIHILIARFNKYLKDTVFLCPT